LPRPTLSCARNAANPCAECKTGNSGLRYLALDFRAKFPELRGVRLSNLNSLLGTLGKTFDKPTLYCLLCCTGDESTSSGLAHSGKDLAYERIERTLDCAGSGWTSNTCFTKGHTLLEAFLDVLAREERERSERTASDAGHSSRNSSRGSSHSSGTSTKGRAHLR
jgi:hypothetical protein